jgi:oxygen-independent coproporphyrinogen-3 oxidase
MSESTYISFCKQACHYCDFHFRWIERGDGFALAKEIQMRKNEFQNETIETIYFEEERLRLQTKLIF